jgi:hypothetical protein
MVETGSGQRPIRRFTSWYDQGLVTAAGEAVLAQYDDWGIAELRRHRLVWSSWGPRLALGAEDHNFFFEQDWGLRRIEVTNPDQLRLFFLSLLWRAAQSRQREFSEIALSQSDLAQLRQMLVDRNPHPLNFYPTSLTQLSSIGRIHNMVPIADEKRIPPFDDVPERVIPIFRFYFDGLIAHTHNQATDGGHTAGLGALVVGAENTLTVSTVTYEASFQRKNLENLTQEALQSWPEVMRRLGI